MNDLQNAAGAPRPGATGVQGIGPFPVLPITLAPDRVLLKYYLLSSLLLGPFFPFMLVPLYFRYHTMRYRVDAQGISMRWGILFRREITLTYTRIQDIHLSSNVVERWLGLARIQVQTASGSSSAEMTIEGLKEFEAIRDYLYSRMRGAREDESAAAAPQAVGAEGAHGGIAELTATLRAVADEVRAIRLALPAASSGEVER